MQGLKTVPEFLDGGREVRDDGCRTAGEGLSSERGLFHGTKASGWRFRFRIPSHCLEIGLEESLGGFRRAEDSGFCGDCELLLEAEELSVELPLQVGDRELGVSETGEEEMPTSLTQDCPEEEETTAAVESESPDIQRGTAADIPGHGSKFGTIIILLRSSAVQGLSLGRCGGCLRSRMFLEGTQVFLDSDEFTGVRELCHTETTPRISTNLGKEGLREGGMERTR